MNIALILSGGMGLRVGADVPKQYIEVGKRKIISYCIEKISQHKQIDAIQIVASKEWYNDIIDCLNQYDVKNKFKGFSNTGYNRQLSIFNGLGDILKYADNNDAVLIHDAARPLLSENQITKCLNSLKGHDGVLPVLSMKDTVYFSENGKTVKSLLDRQKIFAGQAPEVFVLGKYYEANKELLPDKIKGINGSTEPAILSNLDIVMIQGDENNYKITTKADLERFKDSIG